jgi:hypothetical protein
LMSPPSPAEIASFSSTRYWFPIGIHLLSFDIDSCLGLPRSFELCSVNTSLNSFLIVRPKLPLFHRYPPSYFGALTPYLRNAIWKPLHLVAYDLTLDPERLLICCVKIS